MKRSKQSFLVVVMYLLHPVSRCLKMARRTLRKHLRSLLRPRRGRKARKRNGRSIVRT